MSLSHIIGLVAVMIVIGCTIFTFVNKRKHPEKYKKEQGNTFNILFGDMVESFRENPSDYYYQNSKHDRKHMKSFTDQFHDANAKRTEAMNKYLADDDTERKYKL